MEATYCNHLFSKTDQIHRVQPLHPTAATTKHTALSCTLTCPNFDFEITRKTQITYSVSKICHISYQVRSCETYRLFIPSVLLQTF
jgi:hypothetical protein